MIYHILSFPYTPTLEFISRKQCITNKEMNHWIFFFQVWRGSLVSDVRIPSFSRESLHSNSGCVS